MYVDADLPTSSSSTATPAMATLLQPPPPPPCWIHSICVAVFDLTHGHSLQQCFPPNAFNEQQRKEIAVLALPDSNSRRGDCVFTFRIKISTSPSSVGVVQSPTSRSNGASGPEFLYGYTYFHQKRDPSTPRGYHQSSLVLLTRWPFVKLYKKVIKIAAAQFFNLNNNGNASQQPSSSTSTSPTCCINHTAGCPHPVATSSTCSSCVPNGHLPCVYTELCAWPEPALDHEYELPLLCRRIKFRTPYHISDNFALNSIRAARLIHGSQALNPQTQSVEEGRVGHHPSHKRCLSGGSGAPSSSEPMHGLSNRRANGRAGHNRTLSLDFIELQMRFGFESASPTSAYSATSANKINLNIANRQDCEELLASVNSALSGNSCPNAPWGTPKRSIRAHSDPTTPVTSGQGLLGPDGLRRGGPVPAALRMRSPSSRSSNASSTSSYSAFGNAASSSSAEAACGSHSRADRSPIPTPPNPSTPLPLPPVLLLGHTLQSPDHRASLGSQPSNTTAAVPNSTDTSLLESTSSFASGAADDHVPQAQAGGSSAFPSSRSNDTSPICHTAVYTSGSMNVPLPLPVSPSASPPRSLPSSPTVAPRKTSSVSSQKARLEGRHYAFSDVNVYTCFRTQLASLWKLWELMMIGEPVLFLAPSPARASDLVLSAVSLIAPLTYAGDFRPFFTMQDPEFRELSIFGVNMPFPRPMVIGVTNPYFAKAFSGWKNLITVVGKSKPTECKKSRQELAKGETRSQLLWEFKEQFFSEHKFAVCEETDTAKSMLASLIPCSGVTSAQSNSIPNTASASSSSGHSVEDDVNNEILRKYFFKLTDDFMEPLRRCFRTIWASVKLPILLVAVPSNLREIFSSQTFLTYVDTHGWAKGLFIKPRGEVLQFYKQFLQGPNFALWVRENVQDAFRSAVLEMNPMAAFANCTEEQLIEVYNLLISQLALQRDRIIKDQLLIERLQYCSQLVSERLLPPHIAMALASPSNRSHHF